MSIFGVNTEAIIETEVFSISQLRNCDSIIIHEVSGNKRHFCALSKSNKLSIGDKVEVCLLNGGYYSKKIMNINPL